ncbi:MAG: HmuY family protein [Bacteroidia bacterium]|nr:HmuY family protein [Bacteroidia bacterium]
MNIRTSLFAICSLCLTISCDGMFEGIYDDPIEEQQSEFGFKNTTNIPATESMLAYSRGWLYVNTTDYLSWTYIDFDSHNIAKVGVYEEYNDDWDIAIHRYEVKTNNAKVWKTEYSDFDDLLSLPSLPEGEYLADEWSEDRVAIDLSGILDFDVKFLPTYVSNVIDWVDVIYPPYPPTYKSHDKIFLIELDNGKRIGIRLENYVNKNGVKAYLTLEYVYPFPLDER